MHATHKPFLHSLSCLIACLTLAATALAADIGRSGRARSQGQCDEGQSGQGQSSPAVEQGSPPADHTLPHGPQAGEAGGGHRQPGCALGDEGKTAAKELFEKELKLAERPSHRPAADEVRRPAGKAPQGAGRPSRRSESHQRPVEERGTAHARRADRCLWPMDAGHGRPHGQSGPSRRAQ